MLYRRIVHLVLALLAIASIALTVNAQQLSTPPANPQPDLNLSDAQVFRIQGLVQAQMTEMRSLYRDVQSRQESLKSAIVENDPVVIGMAVLALDASEKALKNTQQANERNLLSLLSEYQKEVLNKSVPASE